VQITVEEIPNQLYAQRVLPRQDWDEIVKEFAREDFKNDELPSTDMSAYFKSRAICGSIFEAATTANYRGRAAG